MWKRRRTAPPQERHVEGRYDVRKGAEGYAPIVATVGALTVPAIAIVFTVKPPCGTAQNLSLASAVLVVALFGSIVGSLGLAALAAEADATANLARAAVFLAVPVAVSIIALLAGFEALATVYHPADAELFLAVVAVGGAFACAFAALALEDSPDLGPSDPSAYQKWLATQWLKSRKDGRRWSQRVTLFAWVVILAGAAARLLGLHSPSAHASKVVLVAAGLAALLWGAFAGLTATRHEDEQRALRRVDAFGSVGAIAAYVVVSLLCLP